MANKHETLDRDSIDRYRKQQKRKKWIKKSLAWIILIVVFVSVSVLVATVLNGDTPDVLQQDRPSDSADDGSKGYPIQYLGSKGLFLEPLGRNIALLTTKEFVIYDQNGEKEHTFNHSYINPILKVAGKKALIYDQNGNKISVDTASGNVYTKTLSNTIITADINRAGMVAVATTQDRSAALVTVYTNQGLETATWESADKQILSLNFSDSGNLLLVSCVTTQQGEVSSSIVGINPNSGRQTFEHTVSGSLLLNTEDKGGKYGAVFDDRIGFVSRTGQMDTQWKHYQTLLTFDNTSSRGIAAALVHSSRYGASQLVYLQPGADAVKADVVGVVKDLVVSNNRIYVLHGNKLGAYNERLELLEQIEVPSTVKKLCVGAGRVYLLDNNEISMLAID